MWLAWLLTRDIYPNTDWQDLILTENGFNHGHTLTLTSSSERIKTLTSIGYLDQTGIVGQFLLP